MSFNWTNAIPQLQDGVDTVNAASINDKVSFLAERDQYLFDQLNSYSDKTLIVSFNQPFAANDFLVGTPVYFNTSSSTAVLSKAKAGYDQSPNPAHLVPSASAFVFGLVKNTYLSSSYGDVYVYGLIPDINLAALMDSSSYTGNPPPAGPLYLSGIEAGKFSTQPNGASVFIGYVVSPSSIFLTPNADSLNQLYFNYKVQLLSEACGTAYQSAPGEVWTVTHATSDYAGIKADTDTKIGWITADDAVTVFGFSKPTGAKFYYNVPPASYITSHLSDFTTEAAKNALLIKDALPPYPGAYTMFFTNGVLQTQYTADTTYGMYIINEDGIWWTSDADNTQPFSRIIDSNPLTFQLFITKMNPAFNETVVSSLVTEGDVLTITSQETGLPASSGNLKIKLAPTVSQPTGTANGTGLQALTFDNASQQFVATSIPVISSISSGPGISVSTASGAALLSLTSTLMGEVTDIEPEEADYVYKGLHSYLRIKRPVGNQRIGFVGKLKLPSSIPVTATALNIKLLAFGENAQPSEPSTFALEYSVSKENAAVSSAIASSSVVVPSDAFPGANTLTTIAYTSGGAPFFSIPAGVLAANAYVNFRIARTYDNTDVGGVAVGVVGVSWAIE